MATTNIVLSAYPGRLVSHPSRRYSYGVDSRDWVIAWQLPVYLQERTLEVYEPQTWLAQAEGFLPDGIQAQLGLMSRHVFMIIPARPSDQYACAAITGASFSLRLT